MTEQIMAVKARIDSAYEDWENGGGFSPSAHDLALYGAEVLGKLDADHTAQDIEAIGDAVYEAQCNGADSIEVAAIIVKGLTS